MASMILKLSVALCVVPFVIKCISKNFNRKNKAVDYNLKFITPNSQGCRAHIYKSHACKENCALNYLKTVVNIIRSAKYSVSMCMCILTAAEIQDAIVEARKKGAVVRLTTDYEMLKNKSCRITYLKENGVLIKTHNRDGVMHNKFCLIDEHHPNTAKILIGSLNYTLQGLTSNWETTLIINNNMEIIQEYSKGYEHLWNLFEDYVC